MALEPIREAGDPLSNKDRSPSGWTEMSFSAILPHTLCIFQIVAEAVMAKDKLIWSGKRVMERWDISSTELGSWIYHGLPAYQMIKGEFLQIPPEEINHFSEDHMTDFVFRPSDIEAFEKEHGLLRPQQPVESHLSAKDAQELGRLRDEKLKWDSSIVAAVHVGIFVPPLAAPLLEKRLTR